ncbi:MAG: rod shape-determining protein MreC [Patescibacteria group bacterium]
MRRKNFLPFFIVFFVLNLLLIFFGTTGLSGSFSSFINKSADPVRNKIFNILTLNNLRNRAINELNSENQNLRKQLLDRQNLINENKALKDQFANTSLTSADLVPAKIVGAPGFIPGVNQPEYLIIDKGLNDNVAEGSTIIIGSYLVGKVVKIEPDFSKVELVNNSNSSFTAKILENSSEISGIIKGQGSQGLIMDNVLLSENLKKDQIVLTKGGKDEKGNGYPPDLIVGKVVSVEKHSSDLFQKAAVKSFVNFINLTTVFIIR